MMHQGRRRARRRGIAAMGVALAIGAGFVGCGGGGGGIGIGIATLGISGIVESTGGGVLARGDRPNRGLLDRLLGIEYADAVVTGLAPVNSKTVQIVEVNSAGTVTAVLHTTSTLTDGTFSFPSVAASLFSATNVAIVALDASNVVRLRSYLHSVSVTVDPVSELVFQKILNTGVPQNYTSAERANIDAAARNENIDLSGASNIAAGVAAANSQAGAKIDPLVTTFGTAGSLASAVNGTFGFTYLGGEVEAGRATGEAGNGSLTCDGNGGATIAAGQNDRKFRITNAFTTRSEGTGTDPTQTLSYAVEPDGGLLFDGSRGAVVTGGAYAAFPSGDEFASPAASFKNLVFLVRRGVNMSLPGATTTYNFIALDSAVEGTTTTANQYRATLQTGTATIAPNGAFNVSQTPELITTLTLVNGPVSGSTSTGSPASGTASITSDGKITLNIVGNATPHDGSVSGDGSLIVFRNGEIDATESFNGMVVLMKQATSAPTLNGSYHAMGFVFGVEDVGPAQISLETLVASITLTAGTATFSFTSTTATATPTTFARGTETDSGTFNFTVAADGRVTLSGAQSPANNLPISGFASADGRLVVLPMGFDNSTVEGERGLLVLIKKW